ncbi:uncharacterized protein TNCV_945361 [Trichonephila clavipes]|nr:uncharacterized protein TNCV_945361 [Trichonephila clavipes]
MTSAYQPIHLNGCRYRTPVPGSAADKGLLVYPLDPHPDAVSLYSGCTLGKRRAWYLPDDRHTASLVRLRGGWRQDRMKLFFTLMDPMLLFPGKGLVLPNLNIANIAKHSRFFILSVPNNEMSRKSPFIIHKALIGIGGEPKSIKKLRSDDFLIETTSELQTPPLSQTYSQAVKSSITFSFTQTDENITKIKCPPLKLLQPASSISKQNKTASIPTVSISSSSTQAQLLPSTSTISESQPPIPKFSTNAPFCLQDQAIVGKSRKNFPARYTETKAFRLRILKTNIRPEFAAIAAQNLAAKKPPLKFRKKKSLPKPICNEIEIKIKPHKLRKSLPIHDSLDEDMIEYEADEYVSHRNIGKKVKRNI